MSADSAVGHVLVVEDHAPTVTLITTAFDEAGAAITTEVARSGRAGLSTMREAAGDGRGIDLVVLDLDLPDIHGLDVLETRSREPALRAIPVVVLSGSEDREMIENCYRHGANAFIRKPADYDGFMAVVDSIITFWFFTATLPE